MRLFVILFCIGSISACNNETGSSAETNSVDGFFSIGSDKKKLLLAGEQEWVGLPQSYYDQTPTFGQSLPLEVLDHFPYQSPVRDQGSTYDCVSYAIVAGMEALYRYDYEATVDLSESHLDSFIPQPNLQAGLQAIESNQITEELFWPRGQLNPNSGYDSEAKYGVISWKAIFDASDIDGLRARLAEGPQTNILAAINFVETSWKTSGQVDPPFGAQSPSAWAHAGLIIGYKRMVDPNGQQSFYFQFKNSWGPNAGDAGYYWISEHYIRDYVLQAAVLREVKPLASPPGTNCTPKAKTMCVGNTLYWQDSCGVQGSLLGDCPSGEQCVVDECKTPDPTCGDGVCSESANENGCNCSSDCEPCNGCCTEDGTCQAGTSLSACGEGGDLCQSCSPGYGCSQQTKNCVCTNDNYDYCYNGDVWSYNGCTEEPIAPKTTCEYGCAATACLPPPPPECKDSCTAGCCTSSGTCLTNVTEDACGKNGNLCAPCGESEQCVSGQCVYEASCGNGTCDSSSGESKCSCPSDCGSCNGCCTGSDVCLAGTSTSSCGKNGAGCDSCGASEQCNNGQCTYQPSCGNGTCDSSSGESKCSCPSDCGSCNGCCTGSDVCLAGTSTSSCGKNGSNCISCQNNEMCTNKQCVCTPSITCADVECGNTWNGCGALLLCPGDCSDIHKTCNSNQCECEEKYTIVDTQEKCGSDVAGICLKLVQTSASDSSKFKAIITKEDGSAFTNSVFIQLYNTDTGKNDDLSFLCTNEGQSSFEYQNLDFDDYFNNMDGNDELYVRVSSPCVGGAIYESGEVTVHRCK